MPDYLGRALFLIIEDIAQILFQLAICEHLFELAPRGFAALALGAYAFVHAIQNPVVIGTVFGCVVEEFVVQIEAFVIAL
jgi:hypothetical protein